MPTLQDLIDPSIPISQVISNTNNGTIYANGFYGTGIANGYSFRAETYALQAGSSTNRYTDSFSLILTGYKAAPASLYFYNYSTEDRIEVYQGNTIVASTDTPTNLTAADRVFVLSDSAGQFFNDSPDLYLKNYTVSTPGYAAFAGKLTWTHNPASGTAYTVKTYKGNGSFDWRWIAEYPIDGFTIGCPPLPPIYTPPPPAPVIQVFGEAGGGCGCGKIVCTAMNESYGFGGFRQTIWLDDSKKLDPSYEKGYHVLFLPLVQYLYKNDRPNRIQTFLKGLLEDVIKHRTTDIWKQKKGKRDPLGQWYRAIFDPMCSFVGKLLG